MQTDSETARTRSGSVQPDCYAAYVSEAMDYIIKETRWANVFPRPCHDRIRQVCEAVKAGTPLPFKPHNKQIIQTARTD